ncbi:putative membrane protein [Bartonella sp. CDC_skunk]|nr:putative membrane protein [Bartonella sp. CDC_skunk]AQX27194.1 putative membrane protein [Bartonella sp. Raccoon60]
MLKEFRVLFFNILFFFSAFECAKADFRVCNTTQESVGIAIGYRTVSNWVTEGWWIVPTTECKTLIDGPLASRFYYLYFENTRKKGSGVGKVMMCVQDSQFTIEGIHNCFVRGFQRAEFEEIDTGDQTNWMVQLTDKPVSHDSSVFKPTPISNASPSKAATSVPLFVPSAEPLSSPVSIPVPTLAPSKPSSSS